jgi:hypothetical protein
MSKERNEDKQLLENVDRIVAGEKLEDKSGLDDKTRAALELSREMMSWPKSPSKEFRMQLKAQLMHQLAEQEKQEDLKIDGTMFGWVRRRPAWQLTVAAVIVVIIAAIIFLIIYALQH